MEKIKKWLILDIMEDYYEHQQFDLSVWSLIPNIQAVQAVCLQLEDLNRGEKWWWWWWWWWLFNLKQYWIFQMLVLNPNPVWMFTNFIEVSCYVLSFTTCAITKPKAKVGLFVKIRVRGLFFHLPSEVNSESFIFLELQRN